MRVRAVPFIVLGLLLLGVGLYAAITGAPILGARVWPGVPMLLSVLCLCVALVIDEAPGRTGRHG